MNRNKSCARHVKSAFIMKIIYYNYRFWLTIAITIIAFVLFIMQPQDIVILIATKILAFAILIPTLKQYGKWVDQTINIEE